MAHSSRSNLDMLMSAKRPYLTDGGLETVLLFHEGFDLPEFAAFPLLDDVQGRKALERYFDGFLSVAQAQNTGYILDTPTWRASHGWGKKIGWTAADVDRINRDAVTFARPIAQRWCDKGVPVVINGAIGPHGDGYVVDNALSSEAAQEYHARQIGVFAEAGVDTVSAITLNYVEEAIGVALAAKAQDVPLVLSFTVETDGRLPSGQSVRDAIAQVDAASDASPIYYMINCAHPDHYADILVGADWTTRLGGLRSNASRMSHEELDNAEELDDGDPAEFGQLHHAMLQGLTGIKVLGGCCGTDHRHVGAVAHTCVGGHVHAA